MKWFKEKQKYEYRKLYTLAQIQLKIRKLEIIDQRLSVLEKNYLFLLEGL